MASLVLGGEWSLEPVPERPFAIAGCTLPTFQVGDFPLQRLLSCLQSSELLFNQFSVVFPVSQLQPLKFVELFRQFLDGAALLLKRLPENN